MITEDYVSFETAKLLKEKGFDEKCFQSYPFSKEQIEKIEEEAKKTLDVFVEDITDEINKRVLERIINNKK